MAELAPSAARRTAAALLALTVVTGLVDAVSYLRLGRVFVANMTGNVVFIGFGVQAHSGLSVAASLVAIAGFLAGAFAGGRWAAASADHAARWLGSAFAAEAVVLAAVALGTAVGALPLRSHGSWATIAVLAAALGLQNATVRRHGVPDLTTTVLTLSLTGIASDRPSAATRRRILSVVAMAAGAAFGAAMLTVSVSATIGIAAIVVGAAAWTFATVRTPSH
ncbi:MAG: hypothetical protein QOE97_2026 [Pseudonocardiales bacterium]|jgi:uncharacterized membrane protein YoaK (UPF0700 family)|nr:hypothetical protein [Pseudonocardiales bacterium]